MLKLSGIEDCGTFMTKDSNWESEAGASMLTSYKMLHIVQVLVSEVLDRRTVIVILEILRNLRCRKSFSNIL